MNNIQVYNFSIEDGEKCMKFARESLRKYIVEDQKLDIGSVDDILNKRAGVLVQLESTKGLSKLRGRAGIYDGKRISESIIDAIVLAASSRSIGSKLNQNELNDITIKLSLIEEVTLTKNPEERITIGNNCLIVPKNMGAWLYPTIPEEHNWSVQNYIQRTFKSNNLNKNKWENKNKVVVKTKSFIEQNPNGKCILDTN